MSASVLSGASLDTGETETFAARPTRVRERLTPREAALVHYVLSEWYGEVTAGNMWQAQVQAAAAAGEAIEANPRQAAAVEKQPDGSWEKDALEVARALRKNKRRKRPPIDTDEAKRITCEHWGPREESIRLMWQTQYVPAPHSAADPRRIWLQEAWSNDLHLGGRGRAKRAAQIRCWRALTLVDAARPMSLAVLTRMHGDRPPGDRSPNPFDGSYGKDVAREYWMMADLVVRDTVSWIQASLRVARTRHEAETPEAFAARAARSRITRDATLRDMARRAEGLIEQAVRDYRKAWDEASE